MNKGLNNFLDVINDQISGLLDIFQGSVPEVSVFEDEEILKIRDNLLLIVLSSNLLDIVVKMHIDNDDCLEFYMARFPNGPKPSSKQIKDWSGEFLNQVAGKLKLILNNEGFQINHSIPFNFPGYVDYFFKSSHHQSFLFQSKKYKFILTHSISVKNETVYDQLTPITIDKAREMVEDQQNEDDEYDL